MPNSQPELVIVTFAKTVNLGRIRQGQSPLAVVSLCPAKPSLPVQLAGQESGFAPNPVGFKHRSEKPFVHLFISGFL